MRTAQHRREWLVNLLLVVGSLVLILALLEAWVRLNGEWQNGVFRFGGIAMPPLPIPIEQTTATIARYQRDPALSRFAYDAQFGWRYTPNFRSPTIPHLTNSVGMRTFDEYDNDPAADTVRIAIFGDSFVAASEVPYTDGWPHLLEGALNDAGLRAEVLNFGVGGYGVDQAQLMFQSTEYAPDIVVFGLQPMNIIRNTNLFRPLMYKGTAIPFSKPRYLVDDAGALMLINQPTVPGDEIIPTLEGFHNHPLAPYETYYNPPHWTDHWKSFVVARQRIQNAPDAYARDFAGDFEARPEALPLAEAIYDLAAETTGERPFIIVHLPSTIILSYMQGDTPPPHAPLLSTLDARYTLLDPSTELLTVPAAKRWMPAGHYTPAANAVVAEVMAQHLIACLTDETCLPPRFTSREDYAT